VVWWSWHSRKIPRRLGCNVLERGLAAGLILVCASDSSGACREKPKALVDEAAGRSHLVAKLNPNLPADVPWVGAPPEVILRITVDRQGKICEVKPLAGPRKLLPLAVETVTRHWRFRPFLLDWKPVPVQFPLRVVFGPAKRRAQRVFARAIRRMPTALGGLAPTGNILRQARIAA